VSKISKYHTLIKRGAFLKIVFFPFGRIFIQPLSGIIFVVAQIWYMYRAMHLLSTLSNNTLDSINTYINNRHTNNNIMWYYSYIIIKE